MKCIKLMGANAEYEGENLEYTERGVVYIVVDKILFFYDHNVMIADRRIRVMETAEEIAGKLEQMK